MPSACTLFRYGTHINAACAHRHIYIYIYISKGLRHCRRPPRPGAVVTRLVIVKERPRAVEAVRTTLQICPGVVEAKGFTCKMCLRGVEARGLGPGLAAHIFCKGKWWEGLGTDLGTYDTGPCPTPTEPLQPRAV